jgi:DNA-binding MarR family transcriptional regulator
MQEKTEDIAIALFGELFTADQLARNRISKVLPRGMERSPAQLARAFHVTRGAMTNTLAKLEWAGHIHIRPDWDDARRKFVAISPSGRAARDAAVEAIAPLIGEVVQALGADRVRSVLPVLRELRRRLEGDV